MVVSPRWLPKLVPGSEGYAHQPIPGKLLARGHRPERSVSHRLGPGPWESIDRSRPIGFWLDGRDVDGFVGDTVASAIAAGGGGLNHPALSILTPPAPPSAPRGW